MTAEIHALALDCSHERQAADVATALEPLAEIVSYFESDDAARWTVSAYFESRPDDVAIRTAIADVTDSALAATATLELLPATDWVAESQRLLPPVHAGGFVIHGSHDRDAVAGTADAIEIEAGAAFGTAHHGTTVGCLEAIDTISRIPNAGSHYRNILDLGTGSAVLAIAAARRFPDAMILATDIDRVAIQVAEENARNNQASQHMTFCVADGLSDAVIADRAPFDLVIANILAAPLVGLAGAVASALVSECHARIVLSGLLDDQADMVLDAYGAQGLRLSDQLSRSGWATLILQR